MRDFSDMDSDARISESVAQRSAEIRRGIAGRIATFQKVYCNLGVAQNQNNAYKVSVPFKSIFVRSATDSTAVVYLSPNENSIGNIAEAIPLYKNDSFDFGVMQAGAYLWWEAQPGKTMELFVSTEGRMQTGSQISQVAGGLSVSDGSTVNSSALSSTGNQPSVSVGTTATMILPADPDRKVASLTFAGAVRVGDAGVTSSTGFEVPAGGFNYRNTAPLYGIVPAGTVTVTGNVEK